MRRGARHRLARCVLILIAGTALTACEGIRQQLGLNKNAPDEFTVVTKAPLVLPPNFSLRPPRPGAQQPYQQDPQATARVALLNNTASGRDRNSRDQASRVAQNDGSNGRVAGAAGNPAPLHAGGGGTTGTRLLVRRAQSAAVQPVQRQRTRGEQSIVRLAGALNVDPGIRNVVNAESSDLAEKNRSFTDRLIFWQEPDPPGTVVDAEKEARRLREAAATGVAPNEGEVPTIIRRKRGWLEGIF